MHLIDPLKEIRSRLESFPELEVTDAGSSLTVHAESEKGFDVWLSEDDSEYTVGFEGWHEHFPKQEAQAALDCFAFGLTNSCRLRVVLRGKKEYKWVMESLENGEWVSHSTTALVFFPFWRKKTIRYLSNDVLSSGHA